MQPDASSWVPATVELQDYPTIANDLKTAIAPLPHRPNIEKKRDFSHLAGQFASHLAGQFANPLKISTVIGLSVVMPGLATAIAV